MYVSFYIWLCVYVCVHTRGAHTELLDEWRARAEALSADRDRCAADADAAKAEAERVRGEWQRVVCGCISQMNSRVLIVGHISSIVSCLDSWKYVL
jgi:hypothetical protein